MISSECLTILYETVQNDRTNGNNVRRCFMQLPPHGKPHTIHSEAVLHKESGSAHLALSALGAPNVGRVILCVSDCRAGRCAAQAEAGLTK